MCQPAEKNSIQDLYEFSAREKLPRPVFRKLGHEGPPNNRLFHYAAEVGIHRADGSGRRIKEAQANAACQLLVTLRDLFGPSETALHEASVQNWEDNSNWTRDLPEKSHNRLLPALPEVEDSSWENSVADSDSQQMPCSSTKEREDPEITVFPIKVQNEREFFVAAHKRRSNAPPVYHFTAASGIVEAKNMATERASNGE